MLKFTATKQEMEVIGAICVRFVGLVTKRSFGRIDRIELLMDIEACHCNGNPLRLDELVKAEESDFIHDIMGIQRHIDRTTGQLKDFFSPRFSA